MARGLTDMTHVNSFKEEENKNMEVKKNYLKCHPQFSLVHPVSVIYALKISYFM
jgi:hypothetical protein